ncbi:hypothetical protein HO133_002410 [Letharia lupina]|uniref:A-kinase anchor protein 7-like phosphoesterase domain-containing protein n=1 Tax=Letharia lupina TaxID=560253 RepID=A0A8H6FBD2_9LECA|nr:uncharacterized protein HO133_002410 [Letharia lupina]KAF6221554.1 hypothetical protein HO133_002410 [Letharia lupina]
MPPKPKPQLTHFLLLPLVTPTSRPQLQASLQRFAAEVTTPNESGEAKLPAKAIRPVGAIHLTIGVMSLLTPERVAAACAYLQNLDIPGMLAAASVPPVVTWKPLNPDSAASPSEPTDAAPPPSPPPQPQALVTTLSGLHTHRAPTDSSSLHALPTPSSPPLHPFATALRAAFTAAGFLVPEPRPLSLHATLVNTIHARSARSGKMRWRKGSARFDASGLIARYAGARWATDVRVERVAICEMGARDVGVGVGGEEEVLDQAYKEVASVELP